MILGIDLDGCIDEAPAFFSALSNLWQGKVVIITLRDDPKKAKADLEEFGIAYDELVLVSSFDEKAIVIKEKGIEVYIDDQPEMIRDIPSSVSVMLFRNGGNFDYGDGKWMMSEETGKMV